MEQRPEADLIQSFVDRIGELRPTLVSFNGAAAEEKAQHALGEAASSHQSALLDRERERQEAATAAEAAAQSRAG